MTGRNGTRARRAGATRLAALLAAGALLALLLTGCGVRPSAVVTGRPAPDGPAMGIRLYLVWHGQLAPVTRPVKQHLSREQVLRMLAAGPDGYERSQGLTTEVPPDLVPTAPPSSRAESIGLTVTMSGAVTTLSAIAADQIICTASGMAAEGQKPAPVTISGPDGSRPPRLCPY
ncbi:hypothetical protein AB0J86_27450 [Micromonospora sp. NPDC049559]|uniref:hypothetical protein n=1 Tax=Micromonospora sp. NPDC049559 TaxID=3155923 RepID=UPI0034342F22